MLPAASRGPDPEPRSLASAEAGYPTRRRWVPSRPALVALAAVALVFLAGLVAFGPLVRARVAREAALRNLEVTVGSVRPGFFAAVLGDVRVRAPGVPIDVHVSELRVSFTAGLSAREIEARGGEIEVDGDLDEVVARVREFRKAGLRTRSDEAKAHTPIAVAEVNASWRFPNGDKLTVAGLRASRDASGIRVGGSRISARRGRSALDVTEADVTLGNDGALSRIHAAAVALAHEPTDAARRPAAESEPGVSAEETPPPLPVAVTGRAPSAKAKAAASRATPASPATATAAPAVLPWPDLHALRARIGLVVGRLAERVPEGARVDVGGLSAKLDVGGEAVAFGPGAFELERRGDVIRVGFASEHPKEGTREGTPLALDAELPIGAGDVVARLSGGPVSLAVLGVKEDTLGLLDVGRGTVSGRGQLVLAGDGDAVTFDGQLALRSISIRHARLSPAPIKDLGLDIGGRGVLDAAGRLRLDDAELDMGALHAKTHGVIEETPEHFALSLGVDVAPSACQSLLESAPQGLLPTVRWARMAGTFGAKARVVFDTRVLDKLVLDYEVDDGCRIVEVPRELSRDRFAAPFTYRTYHPDGTQAETTTGPGTGSWSDFDAISPYMVAAVLTTEDGAFYRHHGFNHAAIRSSVQANLRARRFVRGASTITMQLAKNLFLSREKTLSRKIEEVILTDYLEQVFQKDEMMELYLNVVEFGPDVYGVTQAAEHYFARKPEELSVPECFFLASLLPSPVRYGRLRDKGEISEGWKRHLQGLMAIAAKNGKITPNELAEGMAQPVTFIRPGEPRPEPRRPVTKPRRDPYEDDAAWQPLE